VLASAPAAALLRRGPPASPPPAQGFSGAARAIAGGEAREAELSRLTRLLGRQAAQLEALEAERDALAGQLRRRDADCAQLGALLAAVHARTLRPEQLGDFARLGRDASPARAPAEEVSWGLPLPARAAVARPPGVPALPLGELQARLRSLEAHASASAKATPPSPPRGGARAVGRRDAWLPAPDYRRAAY